MRIIPLESNFCQVNYDLNSVLSPQFWDTSGMREVKSFGILIEGYRGGVVDGGSRQDCMSRFGMPLGMGELSALES
jgi:hypothetical protein